MPTKLLSGTPNLLNQESVVESDGDSELNAWDVAVYARTAGTIKLSKDPVANREHLLAASGGAITVDGNGRAILGPVVVSLGTAIRYAFSEDQQKWIAECCGEAATGCCQIGLREFAIPDGSTLLAVTPTQLQNPAHPGATYRFLRFLGGNTDVNTRVVLPKPASQDDAYEVVVENRSLGGLILANDPLSGDTFTLFGSADEVSLEQEIDSRAGGGTNAWTYRTAVMVTIEGTYRVPGFRDQQPQ